MMHQFLLPNSGNQEKCINKKGHVFGKISDCSKHVQITSHLLVLTLKLLREIQQNFLLGYSL